MRAKSADRGSLGSAIHNQQAHIKILNSQTQEEETANGNRDEILEQEVLASSKKV